GVGPGAAHHARWTLLRADHRPARTVQPHGLAAGGDDRGAEIDVHLPRHRHLHHLERLRVGDASAGDDLRRLAEALLQIRRLRSTAVHHHHADAGARERSAVGRDRRKVGPGDDLAAELHHDRRSGRGVRHGQLPGSSNVRRSSSPSIKFIDWMACPAPPLIKLSLTEKHATTRLPVVASTGPGCTPAPTWLLPCTATTSGRRFFGTRTNGSWA